MLIKIAVRVAALLRAAEVAPPTPDPRHALIFSAHTVTYVCADLGRPKRARLSLQASGDTLM